jgi:hypothetical protein
MFQSKKWTISTFPKRKTIDVNPAEGIKMKLGTQIRFLDGREATVIYNSLIGVGIVWGLHDPDPEDFKNTDGNTVSGGSPDGWQWEPTALLREPWDGCEKYGFTKEQCVGNDFEIIRNGL